MPPKRSSKSSIAKESKRIRPPTAKTSRRSLAVGIKCSAELASSLFENTILEINAVLEDIAEDDPGLVVEIVDIHGLHAALSLPGSPIPPAANPIASVEAFQSWIVLTALQANGVTASNRKGLISFDHLTEDQANDIVYRQWLVIPWVHSIQSSGHPGPVVRVLWLSGTGRGRAHMFESAQVFG